ncbi:hypothetical protein TNCV_2886351 [Trichonephila clavipes]|nr:hypothetical protein TNCV_2886351 [Trichonephila clavipes]
MTETYDGESSNHDQSATAVVKAMDSWSACYEFGAIPLKTRRERGRCTLNLSKLKCLSVDVMWKLGEGCPLMCRPRHLTMVQL